MISRAKMAALVVLIAFRTIGGQAATPVVMVHGIYSDYSTWATASSALVANGNYTPYAVSTINWQTHLSTQAAGVVSFKSGLGLGANTVLVGHSQGGLVARLASRTDSVLGIVTLGSPHRGAPLVDAYGSIDSYFAVVSAAGLVAQSDLSDEIGCGDFDDPICDAALDGLTAMYYGVPIALAAMDVGLAYAATAYTDLAEMSPTAHLITDTLESGYTAERVAHRYSIRYDIYDEDAGPFRLGASETIADLEMAALIAYGIEIAYDGENIVIGDDSSTDPNYIDHQVAGWDMVEMGPVLDNFPYLWGQWVSGGFDNDGVVPVTSMSMPAGIVSPLFLHVSHSEETGRSSDIISGVNAVTGR